MMQKTIENDEYLCHKKISLRFLKELGLLNAWKKYIKNHKNSKEWYKKAHIDSIFGDTCFTSFLMKKYGVKIRTTVSELFRYWIVYNDVPHKFKFDLITPEVEFRMDVSIDKTTKMMSLKHVSDDGI